MSIVLDGTAGITNDSGYTGDGVSFADSTPANTLVTTSGGNVGIGTSSPAHKLQITGDAFVPLTSSYYCYSADYGMGTPDSSGLQVFSGSDGNIRFGKRASGTFTENARIDSSGNLLVGNTNGVNARINVVADSNNVAFFRNSGGTGIYLVSGQTSWTTASDERVKTALIPFANAVEKVCSLRAGTGRYLTDEEGVSRSFLIAQDVQAVLPEAVNVQQDELGTLGLQYTDTIPLLVAAIKELKAINDAQAQTINAQQAALESLTARVVALDARLISLEGQAT